MAEQAPHERGAPARPVPAALGWLALLGLVATGAYGTWFWATVDPGPGPAQIQAAAAHLRARHQPGDLVLLAPFYATRAREHLGDLNPVAPRDPLAEDLDVHPRVWVFGLFERAEALRPRFEAGGLTLASSETPAPGVTVDLWTNPRTAEVRYDFLAHLEQAKVWHEKGAERTPCDKWQPKNGQGGPLGRWACPYDTDWFYVAPEWHRMGDHLRLCLWAHPPNQGRLVIQFPNVPLTGRLYGRAGHTLNSSTRARAPVDLDVAVGAAPAQRFVIELGDTWRPFALSTATATTSTVTFGVSSSDAGVNHFCFAADIRTEAR